MIIKAYPSWCAITQNKKLSAKLCADNFFILYQLIILSVSSLKYLKKILIMQL